MKRALLIRQSSLGDILLAQPVAAGLQAAGYTVDWIVRPGFAELGDLLPGVDRLLTERQQLAPVYDLLLDLHGTGRSRSLARGVQAGLKRRYFKHSLDRRLQIRPWGRRMFWNAWFGHQPGTVTDWYAQTAEQAGVKVADRTPRVCILPKALAAVAEQRRAHGIGADESVVLLAPGARWATKCWPVEYYGQLARRLAQARGWTPVFIGGPDERPVCATAVQLCGGKAITLAGATPLTVLAAWMSQAKSVITNDSGPLHLGLAAGAPVVAFFGPTVRAFGFAPPAAAAARVLERDLVCRPCSLHGGQQCPLGHHLCLRGIDPQAAWDALQDLVPRT